MLDFLEWVGKAAQISSCDPSHQDVIVALLGASAALGGLMLVFLGLVIGVYQSIPGDSPAKKKRNRTRKAAWGIFAIFALSLFSVGVATAWLVIPGGDCLYWISVGIFASVLAAMVAGAALTTKKLVE